MTNIELIKKLQASVDEYGELPVKMNCREMNESCKDNLVKSVLHDEQEVTIYNW